MAGEFAGLFTSPDQIRADRLLRLQQENAANKAMGGSMSGLLGQIAAGSGGMLAEGIAGVFGLKTAEEAKAESSEAIAKTVDWNDPASVREGAKRFAEAGLNEAAFKLNEQASVLESRDLQKRQGEQALRKGEQDIKLGGQQFEMNQVAIADSRLKLNETRRLIEQEPYLRTVLEKVDLTTEGGQRTALAAAAKVSTERYMQMQELIKEKQAMSLEFAKLAAENNQPVELSKNMEERYLGNMDVIEGYRSFETKVEEANDLLAANPWEGGVGKTIEETFKDNTAMRDKVSEAITFARSIAFPEALENLPPGPATDKDVEEAKKTIPPETAGSAEWLRWMDRLNRLKAIGSVYKELENEHIAKKGTVVGFNQVEAGKKAREMVDKRWDAKNAVPSVADLRGELEGL